jgi:hypothetical protein
MVGRKLLEAGDQPHASIALERVAWPDVANPAGADLGRAKVGLEPVAPMIPRLADGWFAVVSRNAYRSA